MSKLKVFLIVNLVGPFLVFTFLRYVRFPLELRINFWILVVNHVLIFTLNMVLTKNNSSVFWRIAFIVVAVLNVWVFFLMSYPSFLVALPSLPTMLVDPKSG